MIGVSLVSDAKAPRFGPHQWGPEVDFSYTAKCSCGWRTSTTDRAKTQEVRAIGVQHGEVCLG